jgi:hypothetical protein
MLEKLKYFYKKLTEEAIPQIYCGATLEELVKGFEEAEELHKKRYRK